MTEVISHALPALYSLPDDCFAYITSFLSSPATVMNLMCTSPRLRSLLLDPSFAEGACGNVQFRSWLNFYRWNSRIADQLWRRPEGEACVPVPFVHRLRLSVCCDEWMEQEVEEGPKSGSSSSPTQKRQSGLDRSPRWRRGRRSGQGRRTGRRGRGRRGGGMLAARNLSSSVERSYSSIDRTQDGEVAGDPTFLPSDSALSRFPHLTDLKFVLPFKTFEEMRSALKRSGRQRKSNSPGSKARFLVPRLRKRLLMDVRNLVRCVVRPDILRILRFETQFAMSSRTVRMCLDSFPSLLELHCVTSTSDLDHADSGMSWIWTTKLARKYANPHLALRSLTLAGITLATIFQLEAFLDSVVPNLTSLALWACFQDADAQKNPPNTLPERSFFSNSLERVAFREMGVPSWLLSRFSNVRELELPSCACVSGIGPFPRLESVLVSQKITNSGLSWEKHMRALFACCPHVRSLEIKRHPHEALDLRLLSDLLQSLPTLESLRFSGILVGVSDSDSESPEFDFRHESLQTLVVAGCRQNSAMISFLFKHCPRLTKFSVCREKIEKEPGDYDEDGPVYQDFGADFSGFELPEDEGWFEGFQLSLYPRLRSFDALGVALSPVQISEVLSIPSLVRFRSLMAIEGPEFSFRSGSLTDITLELASSADCSLLSTLMTSAPALRHLALTSRSRRVSLSGNPGPVEELESRMDDLETIRLQGLSLTFTQVVRILNLCNGVQCATFINRSLPDDEETAVADDEEILVLSSMANLHTLEVQKVSCAKLLCVFCPLLQSSRLRKLDLEWTGIALSDLQALVKELDLSSVSPLQTLSLAMNPKLTGQGILLMLGVFRSTLVNADFRDCDLDDACFCGANVRLPDCPRLHTLFLDHNTLTTRSVERIIRQYPSLWKISLRHLEKEAAACFPPKFGSHRRKRTGVWVNAPGKKEVVVCCVM